jgi:hypothetical protein
MYMHGVGASYVHDSVVRYAHVLQIEMHAHFALPPSSPLSLS